MSFSGGKARDLRSLPSPQTPLPTRVRLKTLRGWGREFEGGGRGPPTPGPLPQGYFPPSFPALMASLEDLGGEGTGRGAGRFLPLFHYRDHHRHAGLEIGAGHFRHGAVGEAHLDP